MGLNTRDNNWRVHQSEPGSNVCTGDRRGQGQSQSWGSRMAGWKDHGLVGPQESAIDFAAMTDEMDCEVAWTPACSVEDPIVVNQPLEHASPLPAQECVCCDLVEIRSGPPDRSRTRSRTSEARRSAHWAPAGNQGSHTFVPILLYQPRPLAWVRRRRPRRPVRAVEKVMLSCSSPISDESLTRDPGPLPRPCPQSCKGNPGWTWPFE